MGDPLDIGMSFLGVALLVGANAFFVATEFAFVSVRKTRMEEMAKDGNAAADHVLKSINELDYYIAGTQVGITLASLMLGWVGESALADFFTSIFEYFPALEAIASAHTLAIATAFILITFLHVVLGELVPKSLALQYPEKTSLVLVRPMRAAAWIMRPLIWALNGAGNVVLKLLGLPQAMGHSSVHSVEELRSLMEESHRGGVLDESEKDLLNRVFNLKSLVVRQVMVHRLDVDALDVETDLAGVRLLASDKSHSRYPVYRENLDHIVGLLHLKDLIIQNPDDEGFDLGDTLRPVLWVPETLPVEQLLVQLRRARTQVAMVLDEFGGTSGMVTLQDVTEELLGELDDEFDEDGNGIPDRLDGGAPIIEGRFRLDELNDSFDLEFEDEEVDTVAGLVIKHLGRLPAVDDHVVVDGLRFTVLEMDERRITSIRVSGETPEGVASLLGGAPKKSENIEDVGV